MAKIPLYQVDAFAERPFSGNPAAVCPLQGWLPDALMQSIAAENNLAETAFFVGEKGRYDLRWFTPTLEVELCGHATLASAHVVFDHLEPGRTEVTFTSKSGPLRVAKMDGMLALDFPSRTIEERAAPNDLIRALGSMPGEVYFSGGNYLAVFSSASAIRDLHPDMAMLRSLKTPVIATAPGDDVDFVSRFFAPSHGIDEDPVTGSAHCTLTPYWANRFGKKKLRARQISQRGGELLCEDRGERVMIAGKTREYLVGTIAV